MTTPLHIAVVAFAMAGVVPSAARAADPLLSGYGGPGSGEQVLLGSTLLPPPGGDGGLEARAPAAAGAPMTAAAPPLAAVPQTSQSSAKDRGGAVTARRSRDRTASPEQQAGITPAGSPPRPATYPTRTADAGGPPFSRDDLLTLLAALSALLLVAGATRALVSAAGDGDRLGT